MNETNDTTERNAREEDGEQNDRLSGGPEPIVTDEQAPEVYIALPEPDRVIPLGTWYCEFCGTGQPEADARVFDDFDSDADSHPDDLRWGFDADGNLRDAGYKECPGCDRNGPYSHVGNIGDREVEIAIAALNGSFTPVTGVEHDGTDALWDDIRDYVSNHWLTDETWYYDLLTAWALSTWLRPNLRSSAHLVVKGVTNSGKSILLETLERVSYRGNREGDTTRATMFRHIDVYGSTYFIPELHHLPPDARRGIESVIRNGQRRGEGIGRSRQNPATGGYMPENFEPFSHVAVATKFDVPDDIKNRSIVVRSRQADRRPTELPPTHWTYRDERAESIRNRAVAFRWSVLRSDRWDAAFEWADQQCRERGITGRTMEKVRPMWAVARLFGRAEEFASVVSKIVGRDERADADTTDATVVLALRDAVIEELADADPVLGIGDVWSTLAVPQESVRRRFNEVADEDVSAQKFAHYIDRIEVDRVNRSGTKHIRDDALPQKVAHFCERFGFAFAEKLPPASLVTELDDADDGECAECGERGELRFTRTLGGGTVCIECATAEQTDPESA